METPEIEIPEAGPAPEPHATEPDAPDEVTPEQLLPEPEAAAGLPVDDAQLKAVLEAIIYITDEPMSLDQICTAIEHPRERIIPILEALVAEYERPDRGLSIREVAGGFMLATKPEHHEAVRRFVKNLNPPLKMSLPALETLAVIAYKQPITAPEIMEITGGVCRVRLEGETEWRQYGAGERFSVKGNSAFDIETVEFLDYVCHFG